MPAKWWLVPNLASIRDDAELYWATMRLSEQVVHNILLGQLHLPFMLKSLSGPRDGPSRSRYDYSRLASVSCSRDLLHQYMAMRNFSSVSYCCHSTDFFAITASVILLLAYLDAHRSGKNSGRALLHQRTSDRAIMEEILNNMAQTGTLNKANALSERGVGFLRRLLAIEGLTCSRKSGSIDENNMRQEQTGQDQPLCLIIPYFGVVTITSDGDIQATPEGQEEPSSAPSAPFSNLRVGELEVAAPRTPRTPRIMTSDIDLAAGPSMQVDGMDLSQVQFIDPATTAFSSWGWSYQDAHMVFFDSLTETGGGDFDALNTESMWLL